MVPQARNLKKIIYIFLHYFFLKALKPPNPIIMNPIMIIPRVCGDNTCCIVSPEGELESAIIFEVSGIMKVEIITTIAINAPPTINKVVRIFDLMLYPNPNDNKKRIIAPPPKIIPLSINERGKNPSPLFNLDTPTSAIYITNIINAIETVISAAIFLLVCINHIMLLAI